jgi:hypothetical protein
MILTLSINHEPRHQLISFLFFLEHIFYVLNIYKIFLNIFHSFNEIKKNMENISGNKLFF